MRGRNGQMSRPERVVSWILRPVLYSQHDVHGCELGYSAANCMSRIDPQSSGIVGNLPTLRILDFRDCLRVQSQRTKVKSTRKRVDSLGEQRAATACRTRGLQSRVIQVSPDA